MFARIGMVIQYNVANLLNDMVWLERQTTTICKARRIQGMRRNTLHTKNRWKECRVDFSGFIFVTFVLDPICVMVHFFYAVSEPKTSMNYIYRLWLHARMWLMIFS